MTTLLCYSCDAVNVERARRCIKCGSAAFIRQASRGDGERLPVTAQQVANAARPEEREPEAGDPVHARARHHGHKRGAA